MEKIRIKLIYENAFCEILSIQHRCHSDVVHKITFNQTASKLWCHEHTNMNTEQAYVQLNRKRSSKQMNDENK